MPRELGLCAVVGFHTFDMDQEVSVTGVLAATLWAPEIDFPPGSEIVHGYRSDGEYQLVPMALSAYL